LRLAAPFAEFAHHFTRERPTMTRDKARELSQPFWVADPSAARRDFGWEARVDLPDGMRRAAQHWQAEERALREMPLEPAGLRWVKYLTVATALGALIEILAATGRWYSFEPGWFVLVIVFGAFGFALGSLAMLLRQRSNLAQFAIGTVLAGAAELANVLLPSPTIRWIFAPGWPFGITDAVTRALVLALAGGFFILIVNAILRALYKRRLRFG
jgi:hypothetical protein